MVELSSRSYYIFPIFFNEKRELRIDSLNRLNFKSTIGIDGFSCEELEQIYKKFNLENSLVSIHHAEWSEEERINKFYNFSSVCDFMSEIFYEDKILFFHRLNIYVWTQNESKFFVLFCLVMLAILKNLISCY